MVWSHSSFVDVAVVVVVAAIVDVIVDVGHRYYVCYGQMMMMAVAVVYSSVVVFGL